MSQERTTTTSHPIHEQAKHLRDTYVDTEDYAKRREIERTLHTLGYDLQWNTRAEEWMLVTIEPTVGYAIKIGNTWFYDHASCFDEATATNVNHIPQTTLERDRAQFYVPLSAAHIPNDAI